jgi:hypothetical protein
VTKGDARAAKPVLCAETVRAPQAGKEDRDDDEDDDQIVHEEQRFKLKQNSLNYQPTKDLNNWPMERTVSTMKERCQRGRQ